MSTYNHPVLISLDTICLQSQSFTPIVIAMDRLPQDIKEYLLQFFSRRGLMTMRLVHHDFLYQATRILFGFVRCNILNWSRLESIARHPEISQHVVQIKFDDYFSALKPSEFTMGHLPDFPNLSQLKFARPTVFNSWRAKSEEAHTGNFLLFMAARAFENTNITNLKATHLSRLVPPPGWRIHNFPRITSLHFHFGDLMYQRSVRNYRPGSDLNFVILEKDTTSRLIDEMPLLQSITLDFSRVHPRLHLNQPSITDLTTRRSSWPRLRELRLKGIRVEGNDICRFLLRHAETLETLHLRDLTFDRADETSDSDVGDPMSATTLRHFLEHDIHLREYTFDEYTLEDPEAW